MKEMCKECKKNEVNHSRSKIKCSFCLDRSLLSVKRNYQKNKEKILKYEKEYYINNSERIKARVAKWQISKKEEWRVEGLCLACGKRPVNKDRSISSCTKCLDKVRDARRVSYKTADVKKIQASQRAAISKKPEHYRAIKRRHYQNNKEKALQYFREYRARKLNAEGSFTEKEWIEVLERYSYKCLWCGYGGRLDRDHVIPISKGGSDFIHNIQPLCSKCNRKKGVKTIDFRPFGSAILSWT